MLKSLVQPAVTTNTLTMYQERNRTSSWGSTKRRHAALHDWKILPTSSLHVTHVKIYAQAQWSHRIQPKIRSRIYFSFHILTRHMRKIKIRAFPVRPCWHSAVLMAVWLYQLHQPLNLTVLWFCCLFHSMVTPTLVQVCSSEIILSYMCETVNRQFQVSF